MGGKKMEGNEEQKQAAAREAREHGQKASEIGATTGASKQQAKASKNDTHQERLDQKNEAQNEGGGQFGSPEARPGSRDPDTLDREQYPRLKD